MGTGLPQQYTLCLLTLPGICFILPGGFHQVQKGSEANILKISKSVSNKKIRKAPAKLSEWHK